MHIKPPTLKDRLNPKPITPPLMKKSMTTFISLVNDLEEDEERTCSNEIGGGRG